MVEAIAKTEIDRRIRDWKKRLNTLFDQIEAWTRRFPNHAECKRLVTPHALGHLTEQFNLKPIMLPSLTVTSNKSRYRFYPSALSMLGARGRIDVFENGEYLFQIIDRANGDCSKSQWKIVGREAKINLITLTEKNLRKQLGI